MKLCFALAALFLVARPVAAADAPPPPASAAPTAPGPADPYKTDDERAIYTIGFMLGRNVSTFNFRPADIKILQAGLSDAALNKMPAVDVRYHQTKVEDMLKRRMAAGASKEKEKGKAFVDKFVKENKPIPIPGGGWYLEQTAGTGASPAPEDTIKAHYRGTTVDGEEFDSSYSRGEPTQFALKQVIPCWTKGIGLMKTGGKAKLVCPSDVAYGDPGRPGIKPGATLVFEVELVEIVK